MDTLCFHHGITQCLKSWNEPVVFSLSPSMTSTMPRTLSSTVVRPCWPVMSVTTYPGCTTAARIPESLRSTDRETVATFKAAWNIKNNINQGPVLQSLRSLRLHLVVYEGMIKYCAFETIIYIEINKLIGCKKKRIQIKFQDRKFKYYFVIYITRKLGALSERGSWYTKLTIINPFKCF